MNTKHTPGPWHVIDGGKHWNNPAITNFRIHAASGERGFDVAWPEAGELVVEHVYEEADANLIAAAPDLYRELQHLARCLHPWIEAGHSVPGIATLNGAFAAIAKAEGERA